MSHEEIDEQTRIRREKLQGLRDKGLAYPHFIEASHKAADIIAKFHEEKDPERLKAFGNLTMGGRTIFLRSFGKAGFVKILSRGTPFQIYVAKDQVDATSFELYQLLDLGDQVWVEGHLFRTKTG